MEAAEDPGIDIEENSILHRLHQQNSTYMAPDLGIVKVEMMDIDYGDKCTTDKGLYVEQNEPSTSSSPIIQINNADSTTDDIKKEPEDVEMESPHNIVTSSLNTDVFPPIPMDANEKNLMLNDPSDNIIIPNILSVHSVSLETHKNVYNDLISLKKFDEKDYEEKCFNSYVNLTDVRPSLVANDNFCDTCEILFPEHNSFSQHKMTQHSHFVMIDYEETSKDDRASSPTPDITSEVLLAAGKKCPKCKRKFTQRGNMLRHFTKKLCKIKQVPEKSEAKKEIGDTKPENLCKICDKIFGTRFELIKHLYDHVSTKMTQKYKCDFCTDSFDEKSKLESHLWKHVEKNLKKVESDATEKIIKKEIVKLEKTEDVKIQKDRSHTSCFESWRKKFLVCEKCDCQFIKSSYYIRHILSDHTFDQNWMMRPLQWREDERDGIKFVHCNVCKCSFKYTAHYNKHRAAVHLKGVPCKGCGFKSASLFNCWKHRKTCNLYVAKIAELHRLMLKCDGCSKTMPSFATMRLHIKVCKAPNHRLKLESNKIKSKAYKIKIEPKKIKIEPKKIKIEPNKVKIEPNKIKIEPNKIKIGPHKVKMEPNKIKTESQKVEYNCKKCVIKFDKYVPYHKHMIKHGVIAPLRMTIKKSDKIVSTASAKFVASKFPVPNTLFKCTSCGAHFQTTSSLIRHRNCTHLNNMRIDLTRCALCKLTFTLSSIQGHRSLPHKKSGFKVVPDTDFLSAEQLQAKFNNDTKSKQIPAGLTFIKPASTKHVQIDSRQAVNMVAQLLARKKRTLFKCVMCNVHFNGLYRSLNLHIRLHKLKDNWKKSAYKLYTCDLCSVNFSCSLALDIHKKMVPGPHALNDFTVYDLDKDVYNLDKTSPGIIFKFCQRFLEKSTTNTSVLVPKKPKNIVLYRCENCTVHFHECPPLKKHNPHCSQQDLVRYPCKVCNLLFAKKSIVEHRRIHMANPKLTPDSFEIRGVIETNREIKQNNATRKDIEQNTSQIVKKPTVKHKSIYKCLYCDLHFNSFDSASMHDKKVHSSGNYVAYKCQKHACAFCGLVFHPKSMDVHVWMHHKDNLKMNSSSLTIETLKTQSVRKDKNVRPSYKIPFPVKIRIKKPVAPKAEVRKENAQVIVETITYKCELCPNRYATRSALILHSKIDHVDEKPCPICRCLLLASIINEKHLKVFNNTFECCLCKNVLELSALKTHAKEHENLYNCRECTQSFPSLELLDAHLDEVHLDISMVSANDSSDGMNSQANTFPDKSDDKQPRKKMKCGDQKVHLRQCGICEFSTYDQCLYSKHMMREHKEDAENLDCAQCGSIFAKPVSLMRHLNLERCVPTNL